MPETLPLISFSKREGGMPMPHLLDIQTRAFESLLVPDDVAGTRQDVSLERVFRDLFPISDVNGKYELDFKSYALGEPKYSVSKSVLVPSQALGVKMGVSALMKPLSSSQFLRRLFT